MTATVIGIYRYPLKSARGERLSAIDVESSGLAGDRGWAIEKDGKVLRSKHFPQLASWVARLKDDSLEVDDGSGFLPAEQAVTRLVPGGSLVRADEGHRMVAAVHLVSANAAEAADAPQGCDPSPRANIVIDGVPAGAERGWLGMELRLGDVTLRVTELPRHCLGVYAEVVQGGVIRERTPILAES